MAVDPVCGMDVEPEKAAATSEYEGKTYFFCAEMCKKKFNDDPEKYLATTGPKKAGFWARLFKV
jgi:Cu+-exporting ATPase